MEALQTIRRPAWRRFGPADELPRVLRDLWAREIEPDVAVAATPVGMVVVVVAPSGACTVGLLPPSPAEVSLDELRRLLEPSRERIAGATSDR